MWLDSSAGLKSKYQNLLLGISNNNLVFCFNVPDMTKMETCTQATMLA